MIASSSEDDNFHVGYYRDDPKDVPVFVAAYGGKTSAERDNYKFTLLGDNLFAEGPPTIGRPWILYQLQWVV